MSHDPAVVSYPGLEARPDPRGHSTKVALLKFTPGRNEIVVTVAVAASSHHLGFTPTQIGDILDRCG
jgi:hypothetical protein